MSTSVSLFIGLPLSNEAIRGVRAVMKQLSRKHWQVRWEKEEKWHVTLAFLNEVQEVRKVQGVLRGIEDEVSGFTLELKGLGRFPAPKTKTVYKERVHGRMSRYLRVSGRGEIVFPKVIYMSLKGDVQALHRLGKQARRRLDEGGIWYDRKPLRPHITLGRVEKDCPRGQLVQMAKEIDKLQNMEIDHKWKVDSVVLYESVLKPNGSVYRVIEEVRLQ